MKLLIVEDNEQLQDNLTGYLSKEGYVAEIAPTYAEALNKLASFSYDIVVLDLMLPDGNGLDILRYIKDRQSSTGVLIVSAKNSVEDKIAGLDLGADDYLSKPFNLSELNARLKAIFRRRNQEGQAQVTYNEISIDTDKKEITVNDDLLELTRKEYDLILFFVVNKNRVLTKQAIAEHLWGDYMDLLDSFDFVYQHIKNIRKKIMNSGGKDYIKTMYGSGYKFTDH